jgi:glutamate-1-semialdehyde 2,1-aminomutase
MKKNNKPLSEGKGQKLYRRAKGIIPGGTQLLSKRPELFAPDVWPAYYSKAKGTKVWDLENKKYTDMSIMAVGACILGYADDDIDSAVMDALKSGVNSSLNCPEEIELADVLIELHPWFDMVRYARSGGEAVAIAVRIARAKTNREIILFSGYHGWSDWYLAANIGNKDGLDGQLMPGLDPAGVPRGLKGTAIPFSFNDIDSLRDTIKGKENEIAAIMIEPARGEEAPAKYLSELKELASEIGAVLIFDEITSGFRMCPGGIHRRYEVYPDIAVFAKSMANGYAMAAVIGNESTMQAAQSTFISSTNWTDRIGPAAALATIKKYINNNVENHIINIGNKTKSIWREMALKNNIKIDISGLPTLAAFNFDSEHSMEMQTCFVTEMLHREFLAFRQFKPSFSHSDEDLNAYAIAVDEVFEIISNLTNEDLKKLDVCHAGLTRLTKE